MLNKMKTYSIKNILYASLSMLTLNTSCGDYFELTDNPTLVTNPNINGMLTTATHKAAMNSYNLSYIISNYVQYTASPTPGSATDNY